MEEDNLIIMPFHPTKIDRFWWRISELLTPVVEIAHGEVTLEGIKRRLENEEELCICVIKDAKIIAVCILGFTEYETGKKVLQMPYCGGEHMDVWLTKGFEIIRQIAKNLDCTHIRGCGRPGWEKALPELKKIRTVYECEV